METERLLLRAWEDRDLGPYARMCADPEVMRYLRSGPITREETEAQVGVLLRDWEERGYGLWAVEEKETGEFVGRVGLMRRDDWPENGRRVEIVDAGWLLDRSRWGRGLATEGALATLRWGFDGLGLDRILALTMPKNAASGRVAEKCGLLYGGMARWRGFDWCWYAAYRGEWEAGEPPSG